MAPTLEQFGAPLADLVVEWEEKYLYPNKKSFTITAVIVNRKCKVCGTTANLNRHHKGFDSLWARARPDLWAKRYVEFRPRDVIFLCSWCHKTVHLFLRDLEHTVHNLVWARNNDKKCRVLLTKQQCLKYRTKMIKATNDFIKGKYS